MANSKIESFEDLQVWQLAQDWAVMIYSLSKTFPKSETFGLYSQLHRAVSSISANIAEGFGRKSTKDKLNFYTIAYGSALETKNFLYLAKRLGYITEEQENEAIKLGTSVQKLLNAFMRPLRS